MSLTKIRGLKILPFSKLLKNEHRRNIGLKTKNWDGTAGCCGLSRRKGVGGISEERGPSSPRAARPGGKLRFCLVHKENQAQRNAVLPWPPASQPTPFPPPAPALPWPGLPSLSPGLWRSGESQKPSGVRPLHLLQSLSRQGNPLHLGAEKQLPTSAFQPCVPKKQNSHMPIAGGEGGGGSEILSLSSSCYRQSVKSGEVK